jgi:predicted nucleic acid-binding protein
MYILDTNIISEMVKKYPDSRVMHKLELHQNEIASIAFVNNSTLVTRNTRDFNCFSNLSIENWHHS